MREKIDNNYYELLDISSVSTSEEIEQGYRQAMELYSGGDAIYSLYTKKERDAMVEAIKTAYETLRDPQKKKSYDLMISQEMNDETPEVDIEEFRRINGETLSKTIGMEKTKHSVKLKKSFFLDTAAPMIVEQYRILFSRLEETSHKNYTKVFAITSSVKGEGKSVTSMNLAYIMATEYKKNTILVECDLRKESTVSKNFEQPPGSGLADVLRGEKDIHSAIFRVEGTSLCILSAGNVTNKTSGLVGSARIKTVISTLKSEFDYVIVDSPPILPLVDMNIISRLVDGVILIVRAGKTQKDIVAKALKSIHGAKNIGIVLNGADTKLSKYYY